MYNTFNRTMVNTICYRTIEGEDFLFCVCHKPLDKVKEDVNYLNNTKPTTFMNEKINWNNIKNFFVDRQEMF